MLRILSALRPLGSSLLSTRVMTSQPYPLTLVSVNTSPERAKNVISQVIERVKDKYSIVHVGNTETIEGVNPLLKSLHPAPDLLFCASMWTPEQQAEVQAIAKETIPGIRTYGIPTGLHNVNGAEGVIQHIVGKIDQIVGDKDA